ncbi:MAG: DsbA family protein [Proteobacteria bacterium]|nr:DsbA family protein [Pseudomonadota bacterium]
MKKLILSLAGIALALSACAPSSDQLKKAIEKDPSIVFVAIEKDPEKFIEVVNKAARDAQMKASQNAQAEEDKKRDEEFKNPLKPEIQDGRAIYGNVNAPVTIVEYSDFECPYCARGYQTIEEVKKAYGDKVRIIFKHLPLDFHPKALPASKYFEAIANQDHAKAYKYHSIIFENQDKLKSQGEAFMKEAAKKAGADMKRLAKDLEDASITERINADIAEAQKFGISGTPGFIINGVSLKGAYPFSEFKKIIDKHLGQ